MADIEDSWYVIKDLVDYKLENERLKDTISKLQNQISQQKKEISVLKRGKVPRLIYENSCLLKNLQELV